ncbi:hypothetical protein [Pedobacter endophyticus]|uniref:Uncharacterized protein n=1 Tax=Pedobacter endophyticus TaxID=2789740 RepID=A0A7U3SPG5_9SPHI|nr:hypothetical protein [Pedobacter endophyticus]QPH37894.1 hypothetical protein IZT61_12325 [Pedobacter endophyticus]
MKRSYEDLIKAQETKKEEAGNPIFTDNSAEGYFSKAELVEFMTNALPWQNRHLASLFNHMKRNGSLKSRPAHIIEMGKSSTWLNYSDGRVPVTLRIFHFSNMKALIDDYAAGILRITNTLEELYNEALA